MAFRKRKIVTTTGCFDILHIGHTELLMTCRHYAGSKGSVIVLLNSDRSVGVLKGIKRPLFEAWYRAGMLKQLKEVDDVIIFDSEIQLSKIMHKIQPDYHVKGEDWANKVIVGAKYCGQIIYHTYLTNISTTNIINRIKETL